MKVSRLYALLPAYNESAALQRLVPELASMLATLQRPFQIVIADDASTDDTPALAAAWAVSLPVAHLRHARNKGYGGAIATGIAWILERAKPEEAVLTLDADYTHLPRYVPSMLAELESGHDIVTASYMRPGGAA